MAEPVKLELTLNLDQNLARFRGYDHEGEPVEGPTTLEDLVIQLAADTVADRVTKDSQWDQHRQRVQTVRDEIIREKLEPLIEQALTRSLQPTDSYGQPKGEPTTLAEVIVGKATEMLTKQARVGRYPDERTATQVQAWISEAVDRHVKAELSKALEEAKAEVKAAVRKQGAAVIAETIERMAKV